MSSSRRKKRARRRRTAVALIGLGGVGLLGGVAASSGMFDSGRDADSCVLADVSGSTREASNRYVEEFTSFATEAGENGSGQLCVVTAAGDPIAEGAPRNYSVGPDSDRTTPEAAAEIRTKVTDAAREYRSLLARPGVDRIGSELVEAAVVASGSLEPGDHLLFLSDGLQNSDATGAIKDEDLTAAKIESLLNRLEEAGLLADLEGVEVEFPLLNFHPGGNSVDSKGLVGVEAFWRAWAERVGADFSSGDA